MAAPAPQQPQPAPAQGPLNDADVKEWTARFNDVLARPAEYINSRSPDSAQPWHSAFFGCFSPVETCLLTWCLPCVVFGRTHHRLRRSPTLAGYEPINTSCLLFCASTCVGCHWIPLSMQRADLRTKHHLQGSCLTDIAAGCCCGCCDLVQQDKEAEYRELGSQGAAAADAVQQQQQAYQAPDGMAYPPPPAAAPAPEAAKQ